jgi:hypothetical protein
MRHDLSRVKITAFAATLAVMTAVPAAQTRVDLDALEDNPEKFIGQTVTVDGEVDRVLGPHLFTIDERDWKDLERELAVVVPEPFAAIVQSDAPVRVTGTVKKVPIAEIEGWSVAGNDRIRAEIETRPVLVATEVTARTQAGGSLRIRTDQPVGTSGSTGATVTDAGQVARAEDKNLVGRRVDLKNTPVSDTSEDGFWIRLPGGERIFVMTATRPAVRQGQTVDVQGVVLELPEGLRVKVNAAKEPIYIYADRVSAR